MPPTLRQKSLVRMLSFVKMVSSSLWSSLRVVYRVPHQHCRPAHPDRWPCLSRRHSGAADHLWRSASRHGRRFHPMQGRPHVLASIMLRMEWLPLAIGLRFSRANDIGARRADDVWCATRADIVARSFACSSYAVVTRARRSAP